MDFSTLTYTQIQDVANELHAYSSQMEEILNLVKSEFSKIGTAEVWSGTAAGETKSTFDTLSAKFIEFSQAINDCYEYLMSVVEGYKAVDRTIMGQDIN